MKMIRPVEQKFPLISARINKSPVNVNSIEAMTPETEKKVTGTFVNIECPGQPARICGKYYRGMQYFEKTFQDQERAEIPLSVARWINERIFYEKHDYITDEQGNPIKNGKTTPRYKFMIEFAA